MYSVSCFCCSSSSASFVFGRWVLRYSFWPISDQFAVMPRHLSPPYFAAVDAFYNCANDLATGKHWFLPGQVRVLAKQR